MCGAEIGSPYFEAVLTCPLGGTVAARVPYHGEVQVRPNRFVFQLTSNGFDIDPGPGESVLHHPYKETLRLFISAVSRGWVYLVTSRLINRDSWAQSITSSASG